MTNYCFSHMATNLLFKTATHKNNASYHPLLKNYQSALMNSSGEEKIGGEMINYYSRKQKRLPHNDLQVWAERILQETQAAFRDQAI